MSKYTRKDLPSNRFAPTPVFVEDIEAFGEGSEVFQLFCAAGYGDGGAAVRLAKLIIGRSPLVKGSSLDADLHRAGGYGGYSGRYGLDRAVAFLEYAILVDESNGEAHYLLGHCYEKETGWHYAAVGCWDCDLRNKKSAQAQYERAVACGCAEANLAMSFLLESICLSKEAQTMHRAAYWALTAIAKGVAGARERYADLKRRGFDGGNLLTVFRAAYPGIKL